MRLRRLGIVVLLLVLALPAFAGDRVIQNGIDLWITKGDGGTFIDFGKAPIPAGFFCFKSEPFTGRMVFRGVPVATSEPGVLGKTDTIVQRLDDAVFNKQGVAVTRIQMRALHFEGLEPIQTKCGAFKVEVKLNGEQPVTRMRIVRTDNEGGRFYANIAVNGKLVFTPVGRKTTEVLELTRNVRFPANQGISWADKFGSNIIQRPGYVHVDTDGDKQADTYLPGTSNFAAGGRSQAGRTPLARDKYLFPECHAVEEYERHCPGVSPEIIYY